MTAMPILDSDVLSDFTRSIDRFLAQRYAFDQQQRLARSDDGFGRDEWGEMAELGWLALPIEVVHGGLGGGLAEAALVMDAVGRGLLLEPYLASAILSARLIAGAGSPAQKDELLPAIADGKIIAAFAHVDAGSGQQATAREDGGSALLSGHKTLVLHGDVADVLIVSAVSEGQQRLYTLSVQTPGVARTSWRMIDSRSIAEIELQDAAAEPLGQEGAHSVIAAALDCAAAAVCAEAVGALSALNEQTLAFAKTREQFGVAIGSFQSIQHKLVDMKVAEEEARSLAKSAALAVDSGHPAAPLIVSAAKARIDRIGRFVGESAIQIHGGIGMSDELMVGHHFKRLLAIGSLFGDAETHLDRLAVPAA
jgi:alkylation response protein AidB-like acyl-CoA dehydrogenase